MVLFIINCSLYIDAAVHFKVITRQEVNGLRDKKTTVRHYRLILPDNANQWSPERHTEPFYGGNSDGYTVSE